MNAEIPRSPAPTTPARRPGSVRRTSHVDMARTGETTLDGLALSGAARDVHTGLDGEGRVLAEASASASLGPGRLLERLEAGPGPVPTEALVGRAVASGFRAAVDEAVPEERAARTPLYLLLDDLPVAALIAGYADLYLSEPDGPMSRLDPAHVRADICAGWASDATMMQDIARTGRIETPIGPAAPPLERPGDPLSWHPIGALARGTMRRRRRVDVTPCDGVLEIDAMFRDTHVDDAGRETIVHEYALEARVDPATQTILACTATPRVLPWSECPQAAASAERLVGRETGALRGFVRQRLVGTSTCTHLNDLLRSLADIGALARATG